MTFRHNISTQKQKKNNKNQENNLKFLNICKIKEKLSDAENVMAR